MTRQERLNKMAAMFQLFAELTSKLQGEDKQKIWDAFTSAMGIYLSVTEGKEEIYDQGTGN